MSTELNFSKATGVEKLKEIMETHSLSQEELTKIQENLQEFSDFENDLVAVFKKYEHLEPVLFSNEGLPYVGFTIPNEEKWSPAEGASVDFQLYFNGYFRSKVIE